MRKLALLLALGGLASVASVASAAYVPVPYLSDSRQLRFDGLRWIIDPAKNYRAVLTTTKGDITIDLYSQQAPKTVNSFIFLALNRYFDGTPFHRVIANFVAQGGDPTGTGTGGPGYSYYIEIDRRLRFDKAGVLGMARTQDPNSNGSQFFITLAATPSLNDQYTIFGQVASGLDIVQTLNKTEGTGVTGSVTPDVVQKVTILVDDGRN